MKFRRNGNKQTCLATLAHLNNAETFTDVQDETKK